MATTWKVHLFTAHTKTEAERTGKPAKSTDTFGVEAAGHDAARAAARAWLEARGHKVRSINFTPNERELVAYVAPREG